MFDMSNILDGYTSSYDNVNCQSSKTTKDKKAIRGCRILHILFEL